MMHLQVGIWAVNLFQYLGIANACINKARIMLRKQNHFLTSPKEHRMDLFKEQEDALTSAKQSLRDTLVVVLLDADKPLSVVVQCN